MSLGFPGDDVEKGWVDAREPNVPIVAVSAILRAFLRRLPSASGTLGQPTGCRSTPAWRPSREPAGPATPDSRRSTAPVRSKMADRPRADRRHSPHVGAIGICREPSGPACVIDEATSPDDGLRTCPFELARVESHRYDAKGGTTHEANRAGGGHGCDVCLRRC